jgi:glutamate-ammonia-ligase adenylyltransferase
VFALGRLGTCEFDYGSDADLIFVHDPELPLAEASAAATELVQALSAYTTEGALFSVDTRLRPRGGEGELVITPQALADYFAHEAQAWEIISYTKLRHIAGDANLGPQSQAAVRGEFQRFANSPDFRKQLREMRGRLETKDTGRVEPSFKAGSGGIYDIDFAVSTLLIENGMSGDRGNLRETIDSLASKGLLTSQQSSVFERGAAVLRALDHATRLVTGRPRRWLPASERPTEIIMQVAAAMVGSDWQTLRDELPSLMRAIRAVFDELMPASNTAPGNGN